MICIGEYGALQYGCLILVATLLTCYSLGMVLLEIGLWMPFDRDPRYKATISPSENRDRIIRKCLNGLLAYYTGKSYQRVVHTCLTGNFGCNVSDDASFQQRVYDVVVAPLKRLVAGISR